MTGRSEFRVVNHSVPRGDGMAKVTGSAIYTSDMVVEHMAWAKVLRSPFARARILSIDAAGGQEPAGRDRRADRRRRSKAFIPITGTE